MIHNAKHRAGWMLLAAFIVVSVGLGGCSTSGYESDSDNGWLRATRPTRTRTERCRRAGQRRLPAADKNGDGSLSVASGRRALTELGACRGPPFAVRAEEYRQLAAELLIEAAAMLKGGQS